MKRFCISSLTFFSCIVALIVLSAFFLPDRSLKRSLLGMQTVKLKRLSEIPGRRIVFVGGSNLSHGLDSPLIENELGLPVVNMGVHAGLGLRYIMWATMDGLHCGDIVVIVPEYGHFGENFYGHGETLAMVCDIIPAHKHLLSTRQWLKLIDSLPRFGAGKLCRLHKCLTGNTMPPISSYNEQGDHIPGPQEKPLPNNKGLGVATAAAFMPETVVKMNEFIEQCKVIGATVVFLPPVFQKTSYGRQVSYIDALAKALEENGTPFLVPPEEMVLDDEYFYDTPYHLNVRGYPIRTRRVIAALRKMREL